MTVLHCTVYCRLYIEHFEHMYYHIVYLVYTVDLIIVQSCTVHYNIL
jgi:hypothetical protein